jgi:hypothetical protein
MAELFSHTPCPTRSRLTTDSAAGSGYSRYLKSLADDGSAEMASSRSC